MKYLILIVILITHTFCQAKINRCVPNAYQNWWDVQQYIVTIDFDVKDTFIKGAVTLHATIVAKANDTLQLDLHPNFQVQKVQDVKHSRIQSLDFVRTAHHILIINNSKLDKKNDEIAIEIVYEGKIPMAQNPPWSGGLTITTPNGKPFWGISCQLDGASIFYPCKDNLSDEPDLGVLLQYTVPKSLKAIGNGRFIKEINHTNSNKTSYWYQVKNPINTYNVSFYIGDFDIEERVMKTSFGKLDYSFSFLKQHRKDASKLLLQIPPMIQALEYWCGPYPFYEDGFNVVEAPYLGMEHQSAIAYGNQYLQGYLGKDRSGTGVGLLFDFILVHEAAHEWFGNSISTGQLCDMWINEGFTTYLESLYLEYLYNVDTANLYRIGKMHLIQNKNSIYQNCSQCVKGDGDEYDKAAAMIHNLRLMMNNDTLFRKMLLDINQQFQHQIVTSNQMISFIQQYFERDISKVFVQYLQSASIPKLDIQLQENNTIQYRWSQCVKGFDMPYFLIINHKKVWIYPTENWQSLTYKSSDLIDFNYEWLVAF